MDDLTETADLIGMTAEIVSAYVSNNSIDAASLPALIAGIHGALADAASPPAPEPAPEPQQPAVPIKKSITPDHLISLEDGQRYRSLKRHLATRYGMTPDQYRAKWGLPGDYPMVAPNYAAERSALAKSLGLGRKGGRPPAKRTRRPTAK